MVEQKNDSGSWVESFAGRAAGAALAAVLLHGAATAQCPEERSSRTTRNPRRPCVRVSSPASRPARYSTSRPRTTRSRSCACRSVGASQCWAATPTESRGRPSISTPRALPNPGRAAVLASPVPVLTDGFINEYNLEPIPGNKIINSGPFTVTLEFLNQNAGMIFQPSVISDVGCQVGKNVVFAIPGGWNDACALGVTGDWAFGVVYRSVNCTETYCTGKTNSLGCVPFLGFTGTPSATSTTPSRSSAPTCSRARRASCCTRSRSPT